MRGRFPRNEGNSTDLYRRFFAFAWLFCFPTCSQHDYELFLPDDACSFWVFVWGGCMRGPLCQCVIPISTPLLILSFFSRIFSWQTERPVVRRRKSAFYTSHYCTIYCSQELFSIQIYYTFYCSNGLLFRSGLLKPKPCLIEMPESFFSHTELSER